MIPLRPATAADIPVLFEIRLAVRENAASRAALTAGGVTPRAVARMLANGAAAWIAGAGAGFAMADARDGNLFALFVPAEPGRPGPRPGPAAAGRGLAGAGAAGGRPGC